MLSRLTFLAAVAVLGALVLELLHAEWESVAADALAVGLLVGIGICLRRLGR